MSKSTTQTDDDATIVDHALFSLTSSQRNAEGELKLMKMACYLESVFFNPFHHLQYKCCYHIKTLAVTYGFVPTSIG